jgi:putative endonuclease
MAKESYVYVMTNQAHRVLYTGVTGNLVKRVRKHKEGICGGFTKKYNVNRLVYFEVLGHIREAVAREKQIKKGSRRKKIDLIKETNPEWRDLYEDLL